MIEILKEYRWWIIFLVCLGIGIFFLSIPDGSPKRCNNHYSTGTKLNKAILKRANQIWITNEKEVFIVYNALESENDVNNHLLHFDGNHKLTGEIAFSSRRIEAVSDTLLSANWWKFSTGAGLNCPGNRIGKYTVKYNHAYEQKSSGLNYAKLIDSIKIAPNSFNVTFYYRIGKDNQYASTDGNYLKKMDYHLTEKRDTMIKLSDLLLDGNKYFIDFKVENGNEGYSILLPKNHMVLNSFYEQLIRILNH